MTTPADKGWQPDLVPRPDPTKLTDTAIERATAQFRRELENLRELLITRIDAMDRLLTERYALQGKALDAALAASDKRFEGVNEFRQALTDQTATFLTRAEYDASNKALEDKVAANRAVLAALELRLTSRLDLSSGTASGAAGQRAEVRAERDGLNQAAVMIITVVSVLVSIASVIALVLKK